MEAVLAHSGLFVSVASLERSQIQMKTLEEYKQALEHAGSAVQEKLLAQADADGFSAWELAELAAWAEAWA